MIPIYCYHNIVPQSQYNKISNRYKNLYVTTDKFEKQLKILKSRKIKVLSASEFISIIKNKKKMLRIVY